MIVAISDIIKTVGTNMELILSASFAIGALVDCASSTSSIICESVVSLPTLSALNLKKPVLFILPEMTRFPGVFSTGMLSPVSIDSSIDE